MLSDVDQTPFCVSSRGDSQVREDQNGLGGIYR